jgi:hypothetical protein
MVSAAVDQGEPTHMHRALSAFGRWAATAALAGAAVLLSAGPAFAPHVAHLIVTPSQVRPGEQLTVFGQRGYGSANPVEIHLDSPDGPLLGTFQPNNELYAMWGPGPVTIPPDAAPGTHTLFATQVLTPAETHIRGIPSRAEIQVLGLGGAPALGAPVNPPVAADPGATGLARESPVGLGPVVLVGLGVAGLAMLVAGAAALSASRRRQPAARPVSTE